MSERGLLGRRSQLFDAGTLGLAEYLAASELAKLRRRLDAGVKSPYALDEYGRFYGAVRLR